MVRFRLLLAWLLMAALPLQGMAAAAMLFCGSQGAARMAQTVAHGPEGAGRMHIAPHGAAAHGSVHSHAMHSHAVHGQGFDQDAQPDAAHGQGAEHPAHGHATAASDPHAAVGGAHDAGDPAGQDHACSICAACSQAHAVGGFDTPSLAAPAPGAEPSAPPVRVSSRPLTLPDKPPRA